MRIPWASAGLLGLLAIAYGARMIWPVRGRITSYFGPRPDPFTGDISYHNGIDIAAPLGAPVKAPLSGTVSAVYTHERGGLTVVMHLTNGMRAGFAHLLATNVHPGQRLRKGDVFATVGQSGAATGPHLHFTLKQGEQWIDPEKVIG